MVKRGYSAKVSPWHSSSMLSTLQSQSFSLGGGGGGGMETSLYHFKVEKIQHTFLHNGIAISIPERTKTINRAKLVWSPHNYKCSFEFYGARKEILVAKQGCVF